MPDIVVTLPKAFQYGDNPRGIASWIAEGDPAGTPNSGELYCFSVYGWRPRIEVGERVYIVYDRRLRGYAPLAALEGSAPPGRWGQWGLYRAGGAVAVTIDEPIPGFRGWRYRWWRYEDEKPFPEWHEGVLAGGPLFAEGGK